MRIRDWSSDVCSSDLDGLFGPETFNAVHAFQKREFPGQYGQWDGRVGKNTLAKMSAKLPRTTPEEGESIRQPLLVSTQSRCTTKGEIGRAHVELQSLMRISYAVFCLKKKTTNPQRSSYQH